MKFFRKMKEKQKESFRDSYNLNNLTLILKSMFEYGGEYPNSLNTDFIEFYLINSGTCGIGKISDNLVAFESNPCGNVDAYSIGTEMVGSTPIGTFNGIIGENCVLGKNNGLYQPDNMIYWISSICSEIDLSMECNIINARYHPIPVAHDKKSKQAIDKVLDDLRVGKLQSVLSSNVLNELNGESDIPVINFTNVTNIDKIQYLSRFYDDIMKRFYNIYGHALQTQNKTAQQTTDEIHGMDSTSWIIPLERLECRKKMVEEINDLFGTKMTVDFSPAWKLQFEKFKSDSSADSSTDSSADASADSSAESMKGGK